VAEASPRAAQVLARVHSTPPGFVRAYGDVCPGAPRFAGAVLARCDDPALPWHRVVRADGSLARGACQRALLEREGVPFRGGRVDMRVARLPDIAESDETPSDVASPTPEGGGAAPSDGGTPSP
jgi:methylated-DNA-protein-cysteine methyltransferase related protein